MAITELDLRHAENRMRTKASTRAVKARYDRARGMIVIVLNTGVQIAFPTRLAQGLADASPAHLAAIEISPTGLGLHWPKLDADLYVPGLLRGLLGSTQRMAATLGAQGGRARTTAKASTARENGRKGGRPRRVA